MRKKYWYYRFETKGVVGWRIARCEHPLLLGDLNTRIVTFWQRIPRRLALTLVKRYGSTQMDLDRHG